MIVIVDNRPTDRRTDNNKWTITFSCLFADRIHWISMFVYCCCRRRHRSRRYLVISIVFIHNLLNINNYFWHVCKIYEYVQRLKHFKRFFIFFLNFLNSLILILKFIVFFFMLFFFSRCWGFIYIYDIFPIYMRYSYNFALWWWWCCGVRWW